MPATNTKTTTKASKKRERVDVNQVVTDRIIEALEAGVVPWRCPWIKDANSAPANATTRKPYRGINVLMLWLSSVLGGYSSPYWLTFRQAQANGGAPRKGEKGTQCVRWVEWNRVLTPAEAAEAIAAGKPVKRDEQGRRVLRTLSARTFTVFNVEQCDNLTIELPEAKQGERHQWEALEQAETVLHGMTDGPTIKEQGDLAAYYRAEDLVTLPTRDRFEDPSEFYLTAFHELTHATGHPARLDRKRGGKPGDAAYAREELIAEVGAAMLCSHTGIELNADQPASYIAGWIERLRGDSRLVITAAQQAQKATDLILNAEVAR
jgi:antirestriction protein ArdC